MVTYSGIICTSKRGATGKQAICSFFVAFAPPGGTRLSLSAQLGLPFLQHAIAATAPASSNNPLETIGAQGKGTARHEDFRLGSPRDGRVAHCLKTNWGFPLHDRYSPSVKCLGILNTVRVT